jgi:hypothetical protein
MTVSNVTFSKGYLIVTYDNGEKKGIPAFIRLAQVVMALTRVLIEQGQLDDNTLVRSDSPTGTTLQQLFDKLIDEFGTDYEDEAAATKGEGL